MRLQQLFISNVSHELKNPLMRIGTQLDVARLKARSIEQYQELIESVRSDIRELSQLAETLLELAKMTDETPQIIYGDIRIDEILWEARSLLLSAETRYLITIDFGEEISSDHQLIMQGNPQLLKMAFVNLMENACKFADDAHAHVQLRFDDASKHLEVSFVNKGEAIHPQEVSLIFQPFYRSSKTSHLKGYGVGLSLVERIIRLHSGQIAVESDKLNRDVTFRVSLPVELANATLATTNTNN
jgi:signal transduction histidine kinase